VHEEVEIVTSWIQFKITYQLMGAVIDAIEEETGAIPLPRNFQVDREAQRDVVRSLGLSGHP